MPSPFHVMQLLHMVRSLGLRHAHFGGAFCKALVAIAVRALRFNIRSEKDGSREVLWVPEDED